VIAHELGHIRNRDTLIMTVAATLAGVLLAPLLATVIQLAISRAREFEADEAGARVSGNPLALANALRKLDRARGTRPLDHASPATAHLFIVNPFSGRWPWDSSAGLMAAPVR